MQKSKDVVSKSMNELTNKKQELENLKSKNQASLTEINTKKASLESLMVQFNQEKEAAAALIAEKKKANCPFHFSYRF